MTSVCFPYLIASIRSICRLCLTSHATKNSAPTSISAIFPCGAQRMGHTVPAKDYPLTLPRRKKSLSARKSSIKELQSLLGLASYYHRFIHRFADIVLPLSHLVKKDTPWVWITNRTMPLDYWNLPYNPHLSWPCLNFHARLFSQRMHLGRALVGFVPIFKWIWSSRSFLFQITWNRWA